MRKKIFMVRLAVGLLVLLFCGSGLAAINKKILLTIDEVKALSSKQKITLVDARPFLAFKKGHIQGAVSIPTDETFTKSGRSDLVATLIEMRDLMSNAGISEQSSVVVYGDKNFLDISRLFWVLETFGVKKVAIMNDFYSEWKRKDYPVETGDQVVTKTTIFPALKEERLATMLMVFASIKNDSESIIDARSEQEYRGEQSQTGVHGHIPSAINIPWAENLTSDYTKFKPINELKDVYKDVNMKKMNTVYCNKGKESAVNYVALRLIGANVRAYDGSWYEWSQQVGLPITKK